MYDLCIIGYGISGSGTIYFDPDKTFIKKDVLVVHRFNECDERKNTKFVNKYLLEANKVADHSIFVSEWLRNLFLGQGEVSKSNQLVVTDYLKESDKIIKFIDQVDNSYVI